MGEQRSPKPQVGGSNPPTPATSAIWLSSPCQYFADILPQAITRPTISYVIASD